MRPSEESRYKPMRSQYFFAGSFSMSGQYSRLLKVMNSFSPGILDQPSSEPSLCFHCDFSESARLKKAWLAAKRASYASWRGCRPGAGDNSALPALGSVDGCWGCGNVTVVQPIVGRECWCSGSTKGRGEGIRAGRLSQMGCCWTCFPGVFVPIVLFERKREMMLEMEKPWSDDLDGTMTAIMERFQSTEAQ